MRGRFRLCSSLVLAAAMASAASPVLAQDSKSAGAAQELARVLGEKKMDAVSARDPDNPDQFIAALAFPGQLIVISAKYPAPPLLNEKIAQNNHRDTYIELNSASVPESRVVITDLGADGLKAKKAKTEAAIPPFQAMGGSGADQAATGSAVRPAQLTRSRPATSITVMAAAKARLSSTPTSAISVSRTPATTIASSGATGTSAVK